MLRAVALLVVIAATATFAQNNGTKQEPDSFDIEPPLLIPNRAGELPETTSSEAATQNVDLAKLEKDLERARRNAAGAEHLYRIGAISRLEAEQRALRVVRLESDLATARTAQAKDNLAAFESRVVSREVGNDE